MTKKLVTVGVALLLLAGLGLFNMYYGEPRLTQARLDKAREAQRELDESKEAMAAEFKQAAADKIAAGSDAKPAEENSASKETDVNQAEEWPEEAPDVFKVKFDTSKGDVIVEVRKEWAPLGVERFYELVREKYYDGNRFFRVVKGFVVQFGISGDPAVSAKWKDKNIKDDKVTQTNAPGTVTFACAGPNSRTTQIFINLGNNANLDNYQQGFMPFAKVIEGMDVVQSFNAKYADQPTRTQGQIHAMGNEFLDKQFPGLDYVKTATLIK